MDKYEYKVRSEEIGNLISEERYAEAADIADKIDWRRVKNITMLLKIAALYRVNRRNEDARAVLLLAYGRYPTNRSVIYSLCEVSIELDDVVAAVEYYKVFVKIAPRDNGVFTLRYRILEAQEASLEERIELLEELKKRDYQEEWAYELAYLYHRAGFATKCVEECDDIILFSGDGAYVMKAMELKMLHAPLTEVQKAKYEIMAANADRNYSSEEYNENNDSNEQQNYTEEYYGAGYGEPYSETGYDGQQNYADAGYDNQQGYADTGYDNQQGYADAGYDNQQGYADAGYDNQQGYADAGYDNQQTYAPQQGYVNESYPEAYGYSNDTYSENAYINENYASENYTDNAYSNDGYADENYAGEGSENNGYSNNGYSSNDGAVDEDYTDKFYVEQFYNTDGYPIPAPEETQNHNANASAAVDMSQYNTINLQKVVAESMKELFPDDDEDVFAEENIDLEPEKSFETRTYISPKERLEIIRKEEKEKQTHEDAASEPPKPSYTEGRVAAMVSGISEESPKPNTGAIKKVLVPGEDARVIKEDTDINTIRDTTEQSVNAEQNRIQKNAENVYFEQNVQNTSGDASQEQFKPMTGQMNLNDVLAEWEQIKQESAQKHQDAIKKQVMHQTGKIIANFNDSVKNDMIDEFEGKAEEEKPPTRLEKLVAEELGGNTEEMPKEQLSKALVEIEEIGGDDERATEETEAEYTGGAGEDTQEIEYKNEEYPSASDSEPVNDEDAYSGEYSDAAQEETYTEEGYDSESSDNSDNEGYADNEGYPDGEGYADDESYSASEGYIADEGYPASEGHADDEGYPDNGEYTADEGYPDSEEYATAEGYADDAEYAENDDLSGFSDDEASLISEDYLENEGYSEEEYSADKHQKNRKPAKPSDGQLDPDDEESIAEMAKEDAMKTQEIKMNTAELSSLSDKILATTRKEANGAKPEEIRDFSPEEQQLFENFAVTKKIKKQIIFALDKMTLAAYTGNVLITGEAGLDTVKLAQNLVREFQAIDANFSGKAAKITGEKLNLRNLKEVFDKLNNGAIIIEKANGMTEQKLYEMATLLNQESLGIIVIMEDTKKELTRLLEKQAMIADYFNIRIDLMEMDSKALVAYAKNYALALEYSIDEMGTLALYTRISNMQGGNHAVTKDEVRDIVDEAIWKSKKSKLKNFVDVLLSKRYDSEDMIVLRERDFM